MTGNEKVKKWMESPKYEKDVSDFVDKWMREEENLSRHTETVMRKIAWMSNAEFLGFMTKLCDWESKRRAKGTSNLFRLIFQSISDKKYARPCNEPLLHRKYIYKGITFRLYVGLNFSYRITMGKRLIYQSN